MTKKSGHFNERFTKFEMGTVFTDQDKTKTQAISGRWTFVPMEQKAEATAAETIEPAVTALEPVETYSEFRYFDL